MAAQPTTAPQDAAQAEQASIEKNIASILAIPYDAMPWPAARCALISIALSGGEVYAYQSGILRHWNIWHGLYHDARDKRYSPREWAAMMGYDVSKEGA